MPPVFEPCHGEIFTVKVTTRYQCISMCEEYKNISFEELRLLDYKSGKGPKFHNLVFVSDVVPFRETYITGDGMFQSITSMHENEHSSFEELRLLDYKRWKGPKQHKSVFGKVFQPNSLVPNQSYCNTLCKLNINRPTANRFAMDKQQEIIQPNYENNKRCKITDAKSSLIRQPFKFNTDALNKSRNTAIVARNTNEPFKFNTAALNKSLDTAVLAQNTTEPSKFNTDALNKSLDTSVLGETTKLVNNMDGYNTSSDNDFSGCTGEKKDGKADEDHGDVDIVLVGNETAPLQSLTDNLTSGLEKGDCSSREEVKSNITHEENLALKREVNDSINIGDHLGINLDNSSDNSHNITVMAQPSTSYGRNKFININNDTGNETSGIIINTAGESSRNDSSITDTIDVLQCENNSETDIPVNDTTIQEKNNTNQEFNTNVANNLTDNKPVVVDLSIVVGDRSMASEVDIQINDGNICKVTDDLPINKGVNLLKDKDISRKSLDDGVAINKETTNLEIEQDLSQSLPEHNDQNKNETETLTDDLNNNNSNKIDEQINLFRFDAVPKPRMIVKPSKLQFIGLKAPNTKTVVMPKTISNGYPFSDLNPKNRFNFHKDYASKKAALNAHLQLFSNDTPKPVVKNTSAPSATAPYLRTFTPFSFQKTNTANPNASTATVTSSTPTSQTVSPSVDPNLIRLLQKRNLLRPKRQLSDVTPKVGIICKQNASALFKFSNINSTITTSLTAFPSVSNSKELRVPSTSSYNSKALPSNFGVDIINYGASTSKVCTNIESLSSKGDIAPTFKDLSVGNETNMDGMVSESEKATIAMTIRNLPASMSIDEPDAADISDNGSVNQSSVNQSIDQESNSQPKLSTNVRSETVSAFKGSSLPSLFKGKSLLKKSSTTKGSVSSNRNCLEFNKPPPDSLLISPPTEPSKGLAAGAKVLPISTTETSSASSSSTEVKNPFYLESKEVLPIKKKTVAPFKQFTFTNTKPAFDFAKASTVSGIFSFNPTDSQADSNTSATLPIVDMLANNISNSAALNSASPSVQNVSPPIDQSSSRLPSSVFNNINNLADSLSRTNASELQKPSQSSSNTFPFTLSPARPMQNINSTTAITADTRCSLFNEVNAATNQNTIPASKPVTFRFLNLNKANASTTENQNTPPTIKPATFSFLNLNNCNAGTEQNATPAIKPDSFSFFNLNKAIASTTENTTPAIKPVSFRFFNSNKANASTTENQNATPIVEPATFSFLNLNNGNAAIKHKQNIKPAFKPDTTFSFFNSNNAATNQNTTPAMKPETFGFLNEVNAATNQIQNTTPVVTTDARSGFLNLNNHNTATNLNLNKTKATKQDIELWAADAKLSVKIHETPMHGLVLHREKMRYNNLLITDGNVDNIGIPRNLYFFSAIPVILNQMFTLEVQEIFDRTNTNITIGFTATDPFGINVLELPENPMLLMDRQEYWAFKTFNFSKDIYKEDEIRFIIRSNGAMRFYKHRIPSEHFVDTTVTLWLFVHVKCGIKKFSITTNERTCLSVHHAMNEPPEDMLNPNDISRNDTRAVVDLPLSGATSNSRTQELWDLQNPPADLRNTMARHVDNIGVQNIDLLRRESDFPYRSENPFRASEQGRNYIDSFVSNRAHRLSSYPTEFREQPNSVIDNINSIWTPFSDVTDPDLGVSQSNQSGNVNQSNLPVISKLKRQERENECIICYDKDIDCVLYKCGHSCMCMECSVTIQRQGDSKCPICRNIICDVIKIYKS